VYSGGQLTVVLQDQGGHHDDWSHQDGNQRARNPVHADKRSDCFFVSYRIHEVTLPPLGKGNKNQPSACLFLEMNVSEAVHQRDHYSSIGLAQPGNRDQHHFCRKTLLLG
jgi:hypothetical protein